MSNIIDQEKKNEKKIANFWKFDYFSRFAHSFT